MVPIETDRGGLRPESLTRVLDEERPKVVYVQHGPHNPTGVVSGLGRRRALARVLDEHDDVLVIEDATLAPLAFAGELGPELVRLCRRSGPGGTSAAPLAISSNRGSQPSTSTCDGNEPTETTVAPTLAASRSPKCCGAGMRRTVRSTIRRGSALLRERLPEWSFDEPSGASALWVDTGLADAVPLVAVARRHGVHIASGAITRPGAVADGHLRLCVDRPWPIVEAGIERLAAAWHDLDRRSTRAVG